MAKRRRSPNRHLLSIPDKASKILNILLVVFILIFLRIWGLAVLQHEAKVEETSHPKQRIVLEPTKRGTIRDRFNIPLAVNKVRYQATVNYSYIREIPAFSWEKDASGKKVKVLKRKAYIHDLAQKLAQELDLDADRVEDLIYSKAALYFHLPFVLKDDISEKEYYRLRMMEKDWPGIYVRTVPRREYPKGGVGADILGYMGAINREEYEEIIGEVKTLKKYLIALEEGMDEQPPEGYENKQEAQKRLQELEKRAYTINDYVGKGGIEAVLEEDLRGFQGEKKYYADAQGNYIREYPGGSSPMSGQRVLLTISSELQEYAEQLLATNEEIREKEGRPWMKGGAVVVMDPHTGDILAMASYPRFNPNDYIASGSKEINQEKRRQISHWLESEDYVGEIWDQKAPLERELYDSDTNSFIKDELWLTWDLFLQKVLPHNHPVRAAIDNLKELGDVIDVLQTVDYLLALGHVHDVQAFFQVLYSPDQEAFSTQKQEAVAGIIRLNQEEIIEVKRKLDTYFGAINNTYDRLLFIDLLRISVNHELFDFDLIPHIKHHNLELYHEASKAMVNIRSVVKEMAREIFHAVDFAAWRQMHEKAFLKVKREEEKAAKRYAKPYLDYLDGEERKQFEAFWNEHHLKLIYALLKGNIDSPEELKPYIEYFATWNRELLAGAHVALPWRRHFISLRRQIYNLPETASIHYLTTMRGFHDLNRPLLGFYKNLRRDNHRQEEKHLAASFYPLYGYGHCRSHAFRQAAVQGSLFKIVTAYAAMIQKYEKRKGRYLTPQDLNPLTMIDRVYKQGDEWFVGETMNGKPIPRHYHGGVIPRSLSKNIGEVDFVKAMERSSNSYFALIAGEGLNSPQDLADAAALFSYGEKTGIDLPGEIRGNVSNDLEENRTGLYSLAIGQHTLVVTPLQTAVMLSALANGGKVFKPNIIALKAGTEIDSDMPPTTPTENYPFKESLQRVGIHFPLFTSTIGANAKHSIEGRKAEIVREIPMPEPLQALIKEGLSEVIKRTANQGYWSLTHLYANYLDAPRSLKRLKDELIGKTSSGELVEVLNLDKEKGVEKSTHIWFGGISYKDEFKTTPELVVVVYLKFGNSGKDAVPIATQMIEKWREIQSRGKEKSHIITTSASEGS